MKEELYINKSKEWLEEEATKTKNEIKRYKLKKMYVPINLKHKLRHLENVLWDRVDESLFL